MLNKTGYIDKFIIKRFIKRLVMMAMVIITLSVLNANTADAVASAGNISYANPDDTKEKLDKAEEEKQAKEKELADAQSQLQTTQAGLQSLELTKNSYEGQLNLLNGEMQLVADNLAVIEAQMELKQMEIDDTTIKLNDAIATREAQYAAMKERIRFLYESQNNMYMEILFSADNFGEFLNYADYIEDLSAYDRRMLEEYIETQQTISENKAILEEEYQAIEDLKADAEDQQAKVADLISQTSDSLSQTTSSISDMEAQEAAYIAECDRKADEVAAAQAEYEAIKAQYEEELRLSKLAAQSAWRDISDVQFDESDRYLLANLIYCEAGNQPYEGQLAVGSVVINRVLSSRYPDTVAGVIYQNKQFSPVGDGHLALALAENRATANCYAAADAAMAGNTNVGNCVYFRTVIDGLEGIIIGAHVFY